MRIIKGINKRDFKGNYKIECQLPVRKQLGEESFISAVWLFKLGYSDDSIAKFKIFE